MLQEVLIILIINLYTKRILEIITEPTKINLHLNNQDWPVAYIGLCFKMIVSPYCMRPVVFHDGCTLDTLQQRTQKRIL